MMCFCAFILLLFLFINPGKCDFTVEPLRLAAEVGTDVSFVCTSSSGNVVNWLLPNHVLLKPGGISIDKRFRNDNGTLKISNVTMEDSGNYSCSSCTDETCVGSLVAYVMPSYKLDLSLIIGLNLILFILFLASVILNHLRYRTPGSSKEFESVIRL